MTDRYLLHVGFPKTASTWLQHYLQKSKRINYLGKHVGRKRWNSDEIKAIRTSLQGLHKPYSFSEVQSIIEETIHVNPDLPFVLSDEVLAKPWKDNPEWATDFAQLLSTYFPDGQILLTVRKQSDIACSLYRKHVEEFGLAAMKMREWFDSGAGSNDVEFWQRWDLLEYYLGLNKFFEGKIVVVPYEMMKSAQQEYCSIVTKFFDIEDVDLKITKPVNQANFRTDYIHLLKLLVRPKHWHKVKQAIKVKPHYDKALIASIDEYFSKNNKELSCLTGVDLENYDYYKSS